MEAVGYFNDLSPAMNRGKRRSISIIYSDGRME
jgi:hypothetical protein